MKYIKATFIKRLNRFVGVVKLNNAETNIFVPNTGRLGELLIPGVKVYLTESPGKYPYKMQIIMYKGNPVMIDSIYSNSVFGGLIKENKVPALSGYSLVKREPSYGHHRFDFLLKDDNEQELFVELKSCTLAHNDVASFPDAVSERASSHVRTLSESGKGALIFFLLHQDVKRFVPNYHTDFIFYQTLLNESDKLPIFAYSAVYDSDHSIIGVTEVEVYLPEAEPKGVYCIVLENLKKQKISVGSLGDIEFKEGFYIYTGSGMNNLFKRIERHKRKRKSKHWHLDYITENMKIIGDCPIVSEKVSECDLAQFMVELEGEATKKFGSTDCKCDSHLFYFKNNPMAMGLFWDHVLKLRYGQYSK